MNSLFKASDEKGITPYDMGHRVGLENGDESKNPYEQDTEAFDEYNDGYWDGQSEREYDEEEDDYSA